MTTTAAERIHDPPAASRGGIALVPMLVAAAAVLSWLAPLPLVLIGPLLLGVPHVIGDVRVLWLGRPRGFGGSAARAVLAPLFVLTLLRGASLLGLGSNPALEIASGMVAVLLAATMGARSPPAAKAWAAGCVSLGIVAIASPRATTVVLAHVHNLVAFGLWVAWSGSRRFATATTLGYAAALVALLALPMPDLADARAGGLSWLQLRDDLAPGMNSAVSDALVRTFAFAQLVHYGLWAWILPGDHCRPLKQELGNVGLAAVIVACTLVPGLGVFAPATTRSTYLSLAIAHGWLELAILAFLLARGRRAIET